MGAVNSENEVFLYGVHFPITAPVTRQQIAPFPPKQVIGDATRSDQTIVSEWIMTDWRGGLGVFEMDEKTQQDRYWDGNALGIFRKQLTLPLKPYPTGGSASVTDPVVYGFLDYGTDLYAAFNTYLCKWNNTTATWDAERTLADRPYSAVVFDDKMFWFTDDEYDYYDGSAWHRVNIPGRYGCVFDEQLVLLDTNGNIRWSVDGAIWYDKLRMPLESGKYTDIGVFWNAAGEPAVYVGTTTGIWVLDYWAEKAYPTILEYAPGDYSGIFEVYKDGHMYVADGLPVYRFSGNTVSSVGLDKDDGLPVYLRGNIVAFAKTPNWITAVLDATAVEVNTDDWVYLGSYSGSDVINRAVGYSAILAFTGGGWHILFRSGSLNTGSRAAHFSTVHGENRFWFGADGQAYYLKLPEGVYNPLDDTEAEYASTGDRITPWFDGGFSESPKIAKSLRVRGKNLSTAKYINVYYAIDDATSWTFLTSVTTDKPDPIVFGSGKGVEFEKIRFRFDLATDDEDVTPVLSFASLRYVKIPQTVWGWTFQIDCTKSYRGRSPEELIAIIQDAANKRYRGETDYQFGEFTYRDGTGTDQTYWVMISSMAGREWTGAKEEATFNVTVVAP